MKRVFAMLVGAAGCSLDTDRPEPPRPPDAVDVTMQFCDQPPLVVAYKNDGYDWVIFTSEVGIQEITFPARPTVTVVSSFGVATSGFAFSDVRVRNLTAPEADAFRCRLTPVGISLMTGVVYTAAAEDRTLIQFGDASAFTLGDQPFVMRRLGPGALDLVAINRYFSTDTAERPRVIVRSNISVTNNAGIPTLDFTGAESKPFGTVHVHHDGGPLTVGFVQFETARKSRIPLALSSPFSLGDSVSLAVIPASLIQVGDVHRFDIQSAERGVTYWQTTPRDTTVTFGPALSDITVDTIVSAVLRSRVRFASQPEYAEMAEVAFEQSSSISFRSISVVTTAGYLGGTPAQWELSIPDLRGVVLDSWILRAGPATAHTVTARDARPALFQGIQKPAPGETMRYARRFGN
jgi:hypothetical protein